VVLENRAGHLNVSFDMVRDGTKGYLARLPIAERDTGARSYRGQNAFGARRRVDELDTAETYLEFVNVKADADVVDNIAMDSAAARKVVPHLGYRISFVPYLDPDDPKWVWSAEDYVAPTYADPVGRKTASRYLRAKLVRVDIVDRATMEVYGQYFPESFQSGHFRLIK
jgi:hypothetical protein